MSTSVTMKVLKLKGHARPVTSIVFNAEGDLLFSTGKDKGVLVHSASSGELLGSYDGHTGAVMHSDVTACSSMLATAGADQTVRIWDVVSGDEMSVILEATPCRGVAWGHGNRLLATITDKSYGQVPSINIHQIPGYAHLTPSSPTPATATLKSTGFDKINHCVFGPTNDTIYHCGEDGFVYITDVATGKVIVSQELSDCEVRKLSWDPEYTSILASCWDTYAYLLDPRDISLIKKYKHKYPVNDSCVLDSSEVPQILASGGLQAREVAGASANNNFPISFFDRVSEEKVTETTKHFGPVNALAAAPQGISFASGGEDGRVYLYKL
eukprot:TRINITY_DN3327_c0_g1_i1.p1 TRINITY_DN3327_c0_g1~~TRINITY_DN3327_c0_g1_i1.p1  ORF type:complete len:326 (+),score=43.41 TRINITY_DN3327_c0_g1_i1:52-1029(+)